MGTFESRPGQLAGVWVSQDDYIMHISNQMVRIWKHCEFPNGRIHSCRPYIDRMESKPPQYVLVIRTPHDRAKTIDWSKAEWTVNVVGEPQLKIRGVRLDEHILFGKHAGWDIMFYVDVLDVVKLEGKCAENVIIDEDTIMPLSVSELTALNDTVNPLWPKNNPAFKYIANDVTITKELYLGGNTMNNHEFELAIRDGGYTGYQRHIIKGFLMRYGLLSNTKLEEVRNIRRDLRPSPKKVIYNGPATVVIFEDGSKTVVKLQEGETMDREKAVYAAICKRMFGSNKNRSNWLDILKPLMKNADEAWKAKCQMNILNTRIKEYSGRMEFDNYDDAAGFIRLRDVLYKKYDKNERIMAKVLGYPGVIALRKAVKAAKEMVKDAKEKA